MAYFTWFIALGMEVVNIHGKTWIFFLGGGFGQNIQIVKIDLCFWFSLIDIGAWAKWHPYWGVLPCWHGGRDKNVRVCVYIYIYMCVCVCERLFYLTFPFLFLFFFFFFVCNVRNPQRGNGCVYCLPVKTKTKELFNMHMHRHVNKVEMGLIINWYVSLIMLCSTERFRPIGSCHPLLASFQPKHLYICKLGILDLINIYYSIT
jgi:hypothetical protein